ncbi:MAG: YicC/YloC family endoribonuclease [Anaerovibrio sp.]|uniref:YicC/YloC family endoribonuclease n=1 Tax=Anaerovibrio lipolyticus TaxID=82374 RepID=UPI001F38CA3A|nr:YicC/YloC family endoribonuclease [Anaerovibrio lipolyticus]MCI6910320.1 YicC family protein [Veillonellaceae bacterium]MDY4485915.1 YicC/YloC family endoribonuclease [Anaerovibrio sp.]MCF2600045.1 YicC family protein [Anaerovibrio lipolyticus]MCI7091156.1 YicC family protein [Veillonellaceae bacterium]MCI7235710.1 YicC family protein [Veillonellaceae bacterium]
MIKSMTGFGAGDAETADFKVHIEVKAVNQRFLETNYHMPYSMNMFENQLTKKIKEYASRGKLDINIRFQDLRDKAVTVKVDKGLVAAYGQALQEISSQLELSAPVTAAQIASYPDVLKLNEENADLEAAQPVLMQAMEQALESFVAMREAEGQNIQRDLLARIGTLENFVGELEKLAPEIVAAYRQRLENLLREYLAKEDIEESRIIQEVALFTDKVNYTEETVRLRSHFDQFRQIITAGEPVGRKLDFLIQEMNREINTVASKANSAGAAQFVVDVKSEIEKIREQIQNIE